MALCIRNFVCHNPHSLAPSPPPPKKKNSWNSSLTKSIQLFKESYDTLEL